MSAPIPETTRIITIDSGSRRSANGTCRSPEAIHVKTPWSITRFPAAVATSDHDIAADTPKEANITATASAPDAALDSRRPTAALATKPRNGRSGISSSMRLVTT